VNPNVIHTFVEVIFGRSKQSLLEGGYWYIVLNSSNIHVKINNMDDELLKSNVNKLCRLVNLKIDKNGVGIPFDGYYCTVTDFDFVPEIVYGRPLMVSTQKLLPTISDTTSDWATYNLQTTVYNEIDQLTENDRIVKGTKWLNMAQEEYSSIASFGRLILDITRFGFPAEFVDRITDAISDEVRHARIFLSLASQALKKPMGFDQLRWGTVEEKTWDQLKNDNYRDACCNEAHSADMLLKEAEDIKIHQPGIGMLFQEIGTDEKRHSKLGEDIHTFMSIL
jgi:hypothetical protein